MDKYNSTTIMNEIYYTDNIKVIHDVPITTKTKPGTSTLIAVDF